MHARLCLDDLFWFLSGSQLKHWVLALDQDGLMNLSLLNPIDDNTNITLNL
jgi:hypothetical protein